MYSYIHTIGDFFYRYCSLLRCLFLTTEVFCDQLDQNDSHWQINSKERQVGALVHISCIHGHEMKNTEISADVRCLSNGRWWPDVNCNRKSYTCIDC